VQKVLHAFSDFYIVNQIEKFLHDVNFLLKNNEMYVGMPACMLI